VRSTGDTTGRASLRRPVSVFALTGVLVLTIITVAVVLLIDHRGRDEAIRDARRLTDTYAHSVVGPALTDGVLAQDPAALAAFVREVTPRLEGSVLTRTKIWRADGTVVYSDEPRLVGMSFELDDDSRDVLENGGAEAEIGDTNNPENLFERSDETVLEVYQQVSTPSGQHALFEVYLPYASVQDSGREVWLTFAPVAVLALALLWLLQLPSAWSMARQIRAGQATRERLLRRALDASDAERRRIATELHNGVVQTMAGVSYSLGAAGQHLPPDTPEAATRLLDEASEDTRASIRELRVLLVEIYPPRLREAGLESVLGDLLAPLEIRGIDGELRVSLPERPSAEVELILYRTAQEALRNVIDHAEAHHVVVDLSADSRGWVLSVVDDGRGIDPAVAAALRVGSGPSADGHHLGLRLLGELAADVDGALTVATEPGAGTRVELRIPAG
jgi:signal transduction histidine kinase